MKLADLTTIPLPTDRGLTETVYIRPGARHDVHTLAAPYLGETPLVVADPETWAAVSPLPEAVAQWPRLVLPTHPHADDETVEQVRARMESEGATGALAIGAGTINDLCKRACHLLEKPYVVLGTAASMNGYASGIAAIMSAGLKTTVPATPPRSIILDTEILSQAPMTLTHAGLGDLISKPVSDTCWWLADQLDGVGYSTTPGKIVEAAVAGAAAAAGQLPEPEAVGALGKALVLSGVSMVVAGSSSPASGGEHLLSHLWDMEAVQAGEETRLHGTQVGVTTCITAALYQRLLKVTEPDFPPVPSWADEEARLKAAHGELAPIVLEPSKGKHGTAERRVAIMRARWSEMLADLKARTLPTPAEVRAILDAAGAPSTLEAINEDRANAARVLRLARDIRNRITVLDVAYDLGVLPDAAEAVLDEAGV
ncbi:MAG: iron-containing alcohol dehydrogenase [Bradymonadia bacterium]